MAGTTKKDNGWLFWALIVFLFAAQLPLVALLLLYFKLFGNDEKKRTTGKSSRAGDTVRKMTKSPKAKKSNATILKWVGGLLGVCGLFAIQSPIGALFWSGDWFGLWFEDFMMALTFLLGGGAMAWSGVEMDRALRRYAKYLSVMGDRSTVTLYELASTLGYTERRVERDLQKMIDRGYFGGRAYLNVETGRLFRSGEAREELERQQAEQRAKQAAKTAEEGYSSVLARLRRANDLIEDEVLSAKIDRLESVTARILRAVEEDPKKKENMDTFFGFYLPTTQKLLDSYAEFEDAGIEGENLRQAKQRIEDTMDSIIRGFEHQLDQLYKADAMDVDSDIRVMETMLKRDTARVSDDFGMGAAAVQMQEE